MTKPSYIISVRVRVRVRVRRESRLGLVTLSEHDQTKRHTNSEEKAANNYLDYESD